MPLVAVMPGDGIGPEVVAEALKVLSSVRVDLVFEMAPFGGAAYDLTGQPLPDATLSLCRRADAILLGAVGGPKWDALPLEVRPELGGLLRLRSELGLYANLRPAKVFAAMADACPLKEGASGIDLIVVRELTGGIYFGQPRERRDGGSVAVDTCVYSRSEVERVSRRAFEVARTRRRQVTSVDKANVLETSRLWREVVEDVAKDYPDVALTHMLVDNCAMQLIRSPKQFDVILTENLFGDILSDEAAMLTGSLGMLPSASLGESGSALYEPSHGSAPDIAGQGKANPIATVLSAAMMLQHSFGDVEGASKIEDAVGLVLAEGVRTPDIVGPGFTPVTTSEMGDAIVRALGR